MNVFRHGVMVPCLPRRGNRKSGVYLAMVLQHDMFRISA